MTDYPPLPFKGSDLPLNERYDAVVKEFNDRLIDRTQGLLATASKHRKGRSAASFRAGWEQGVAYAKYLRDENLEQSLQQHLDQ